VRLLDLLVDQLEASRHGGNVGGRRFDRAAGDDERLLAQDTHDLGGVDAANAVGFQQARRAALAQAGGLGGRRGHGPQIEEPIGGRIVAEFERLRIVAPELLADAIGQPIALLLQILGHARPLAQFDHDRVFDSEPAEAMPVGAQRVGEHVGVAAVVLGAGDGVAIAEAVELLGIDRIDLEAALEQDLDDGTVRRLDRNGDRRRLRAARRLQPTAHLRQPDAAVCEGALVNNLAAGVNKADLVRLGRPIDAGVKSNVVAHIAVSRMASDRRDADQSLYWRSRRNSPLDLHRGQPAGARVPPRCSRHRGRKVTPGRPARPASLTIKPATDT